MNTEIPVPSTSDSIMAPGSILTHVGGGLALILFVILAIAWVVRRTGLHQRGLQGHQRVTIKESHSLGQRERVVVVEINNKQLLLGVTPGHINCLAVFDQPEDAVPSDSAAQDGEFRTLLSRLLPGRQ